MTFERGWVLLIAWLPLLWLAWNWRTAARRGALVLKALALTCILLALSAPKLAVLESKVAVTILADTSASLPDGDLDRVSSIAEKIYNSRGRHWAEVIPFARGTRPVTENERDNGLNFSHAVGEAASGTDLEAAIRDGMARLPAGLVPRLVVISDGNENLGSAARAAWQARQLGIPIDTYILNGRPRPELHLEAVTLPVNAFTGERFPIDIAIDSPRKTTAMVEIAAGGKQIGVSPVELEPGPNQLRVHARLTTAGAIELAGVIRALELGEVRFTQALTMRRPRVLLLSKDPPGTEVHLTKALTAAEFEVVRSSAVPPDGLNEYQLVIFNNWDLESLPAMAKNSVESFVKEGGGLVVIAGEQNVYVEKQGREDALERTLPAKLAPPRSPEGTCVVLVVDRSSSMEGQKIELARQASIGVVENLRPVDMVGVLQFDIAFQWVVPIRKADNRAQIGRMIGGIIPDGGTQIPSALEEAYQRILPINASYKHIVLLTDGISDEGDSLNMALQAAENGITISTVGIGEDVSRKYLEQLAGNANGKAYFVTDPTNLAQILLRDVMDHTGSTTVEEAFRPVVAKRAEILAGVDMENAPPLAGYVRFNPKRSADVLLKAGSDPLLVRWQYGLGKASVFTSDAKSRWAANWVGWQGFDRFWTNLLRDLLPHTQPSEATAKYDSANDELVIEYRLGRGLNEPVSIPNLYVIGQGGFQKAVKLEKVADRTYRGRLRISRREGLFRVRPLAVSREFPEAGVYIQEREMAEYGSNESLLRQISNFTGGRFNPEYSKVFDAGGRTVRSTMRLWPILLVIGIALNVIELIQRKWNGIITFFRPRRRPGAPAPAAN